MQQVHAPPCATVTQLSQTVDKQREELNAGLVSLAVIKTKLNLILGILAFVGTALGGLLIDLIFGK